MEKLSPHYRNDGVEGLDPTIRDYLDEHFLKHLPNLEKTNPKVVVLFSGGNAMGKSTLAKKIQNELGGLIIENDAVKRCLLEFMPELRDNRNELNKLTWQYTMGLYPRLEQFTKNGLVVRDGAVDWYYDRILPVFEKLKYNLFIISYDIGRKKAEELIRARGDTPTTTVDRLLTILDDHYIHMKRFRARYKSNVTLDESNLFDHDSVIRKLKQHIENCSIN